MTKFKRVSGASFLVAATIATQVSADQWSDKFPHIRNTVSIRPAWKCVQLVRGNSATCWTRKVKSTTS